MDELLPLLIEKKQPHVYGRPKTLYKKQKGTRNADKHNRHLQPGYELQQLSKGSHTKSKEKAC